MILNINGFDIELTRKAVKNINLRIIPPDGKIRLSASFRMADREIEDFIYSHSDWIRTRLKRLKEQASQRKENQISNDVVYLWGKRYALRVAENCGANKISLTEDSVVLETVSQCSMAQREAFICAWYRLILQKEIAQRLPLWERKTGLLCRSWHIKNMRTRWGTCNARACRLWFNLQLARKPLECLDYVILHEIIHLKEPNHQKAFQELMSKYMPSWRERRKILNTTP